MATENVPVPSAEELTSVATGGGRGGGEEQGTEGESRPHEVIKLKVTGFQLSAKDFNYQLEVWPTFSWVFVVYIYNVPHR